MGVFKRMMLEEYDKEYEEYEEAECEDDFDEEAAVERQFEAQIKADEEERLIEKSIAAQEREHKNV